MNDEFTIVRPWCIHCQKPMASSGRTKRGIPRFQCSRCKRFVQAVVDVGSSYLRNDEIAHRLLYGWSSRSIAHVLKIDVQTVVPTWKWICGLTEEEKLVEKNRLDNLFGQQPPGLDARGRRKLTELQKDEKIKSLLRRGWSAMSICRQLKTDSRRVARIRNETNIVSDERKNQIEELGELWSRRKSVLTIRNMEGHPWRIAERESFQKSMARKSRCSKTSIAESKTPGRPVGYSDSNVGGAVVPVAILQKFFAKSGLSKCQVARKMGMFKNVPDIWKLNEMLGFVKKTGSGKPQQFVTKHTALRIAKAIGVSQFELGI